MTKVPPAARAAKALRDRGRKRARRFVATAAAVLVPAGIALGAIVALKSPPPKCVALDASAVGKKRFAAPPCQIIGDVQRVFYLAHLDTNFGPIDIRLDPILAPKSVNVFVFLARAHFYDGLRFHRIENAPDHALVQTGDPTGTGRGNAGFTFAEAPSPITQYNRGVVAMANTGPTSSNGSQFFMIVRDYRALSPPASTARYPFFGFVINKKSYETLDKIVGVPLDGTRPRADVILREVKVEETDRFPQDDSGNGP